MTIDVEGAAEVERRLRGLATFLHDLRPLWPRLVPVFIGWEKEQFASEGAWGGEKWPPLSADYAKEKAKRHPGRSILVAEGKLRQAVSRPRRAVTATTMTLTIDDPKAGYHQTGSGRVPKRQVIPDTLPRSAEHDVERVSAEFAAEMIRRFDLEP